MSPGPFESHRDVVRAEWIDHNGHMNVGYYGVVFDLATDAWLAHLGLDDAHRRAERITTFTLEAHLTYQREVLEGEALRFTTQLLGFDAKRIHYLHRMVRDADGALAATNELLSLHVSETTRRGAPMHERVLARIAEIGAEHGRLPVPAEAGRVIGLDARPTTPGRER